MRKADAQDNITRFKSLPVGTVFSIVKEKLSERFKKVGPREVIRIKPNGIGETHKKIPFTTKNTRCYYEHNGKPALGNGANSRQARATNH